MAHPDFSIFVSSTLKEELARERYIVRNALAKYKLQGWLWEEDAGARPEPIDSTYLGEVASCSIYVGLFWLSYGLHTIKEFEHARKHNKPCLIYEKFHSLDRREHELQTFLDKLECAENRENLTVARFQTEEQLAQKVQDDVMRLLISGFEYKQLLDAPKILVENKTIQFNVNIKVDVKVPNINVSKALSRLEKLLNPYNK